MKSMWGESHDTNMKSFEGKVDAIELKNQKHLQDVTGLNGNNEPDKLSNHYLIQWEGYNGGIRYSIGFRHETYIPKFLQDEVITSFKQVFSS